MKKTKIFILLVVMLAIGIITPKTTKAYTNSVEIDNKIIMFGNVEADEKDNGVGSIKVDETTAGSNYKLYYQVVVFPDVDYKKWIQGGQTIEEKRLLVPAFEEEKWIETTDGGFYIDRTKLEMADHSTVWAKLVKSDNTEVYNYQTYAIGGVLDGDEPKDNPTEIKVTGVKLNKSTLSIEEGSKSSIYATITPTDAKDKTVTWSSSDEKIATVKDGEVTAIKEGTATITVKTNDGSYTDTCKVTVTKKKEEPKVDPTVANKPISQAGTSFIYTGIVIVSIILCVVLYKKNKSLKF